MHQRSLQAVQEIRAAAGPDASVVFVSGNFNIVHPGHTRLLNFAASCGDFLVVGVSGMSGSGAIVPESLRLESVKCLGIVNYAFTLNDPPSEFIALLKPAVVVKGKEHEGGANPEKPIVEQYGGQLLFSSGDVVFSSLDLIRREFRRFSPSTISKPLDYPARHQFGFDDLRNILARIRGLRVTVIGDLIVDEYIACDTLGISQEDPTIVVTPVLTQEFVGGAGIVAAHARGLGAIVRLISVCGQDSAAEFARAKLKEYGVESHLFGDESRPTTVKQRYRASGKTLLRVSHLKQHMIDAGLQADISNKIKESLAETDLVVFSDFNYGCLPQTLVDEIAAACAERGVAMVADSQSSSQVGDVSRFSGTLLLAPTEREARLAVRDFSSGLIVLVDALREKACATNIILKLGGEGLLVHARDNDGPELVTDQLPALNLAPKDVAGAGDSLLMASSLALVAGADIWIAAYLGALAAACQIGRMGNIPLTSEDLQVELSA